MKSLSTLLVLLIFSSIIHGQDLNPNKPIATSEEIIERIFRTSEVDGQDQKQISRMGDAAAVVMTKLFSDKEPTPLQIDMAILIIHSAFPDVRGGRIITLSGVKNLSDRHPKTTLFLLQYLNLCTTDQELKKRIEDTLASVRAFAMAIQNSQAQNSSMQ